MKPKSCTRDHTFPTLRGHKNSQIRYWKTRKMFKNTRLNSVMCPQFIQLASLTKVDTWGTPPFKKLICVLWIDALDTLEKWSTTFCFILYLPSQTQDETHLPVWLQLLNNFSQEHQHKTRVSSVSFITRYHTEWNKHCVSFLLHSILLITASYALTEEGLLKLRLSLLGSIAGSFFKLG